MVVYVPLRQPAFPLALTLLLTALTLPLHAQKGGGGGQNASSSSQSSSQSSSAAPASTSSSSSQSSASLQGISYTHDSWSEISVLPPPKTFGIADDDTVSPLLDNLQRHSFRKDVILLCYTLKQNPSAAQPFILEPTPPLQQTSPGMMVGNQIRVDTAADINKYELCNNQLKTDHRAISLIMGRFLVVRIDLSKVPPGVRERIATLNLNLTSAAGTAINSQRGSTLNPSLMRPRTALLSGQTFPCNTDRHSFSKYTVAGGPLRAAFCPNDPLPPPPLPALLDLPPLTVPPRQVLVDDPTVVYIVWPVPLAADTLPSISVNLIYTPVAPALPWRQETFYPAGSIVLSTAGDQTNGHYYMALAGTTTPPAAEPDFNDGAVWVPRFPDGGPGLAWRKIGPVCTNAQPSAGGTSGGGGTPASSIPVEGLPPWTAGGIYYHTGDLIVPPIPNCHYYRANVTAANGTAIAAGIPPNGATPAFTTDGKATQDGNPQLSWQDMGAIAVPAWAANTSYAAGAYIVPSPGNGYYYQAIAAGVSGAFQPGFRLDDHADVRESSGLTWLDVGAATTPPAAIKVLKRWTPRTPYILGDGLFDRATGHYYLAIEPGVSGRTPPPFAVPAPQVVGDAKHLWQDIGTTPPASDPPGTQPADQTVSLLNLTLPQVHSLAWFNVASGMVASSLRPSVVTTYPGTAIPASIPTNIAAFLADCPQGVSACSFYSQTKGSRLIDPVVGLTVYALKPLDVEAPFRLTDLIPAPVFNLSITSPTTNFHVGLASEFFLRNLQLVYGASLVEDTRVKAATILSTTTTTAGVSTTAPVNIASPGDPPQYVYSATNKKLNYGGYFGFTLNITGLINAISGVIP